MIQAAASEARNAAAAATSAGVPSRLSGWIPAQQVCWAAGISSRLRSVRMVSGAMQLARIAGPHSTAIEIVSWMTDAFTMLYTAPNASGMR